MLSHTYRRRIDFDVHCEQMRGSFEYHTVSGVKRFLVFGFSSIVLFSFESAGRCQYIAAGRCRLKLQSFNEVDIFTTRFAIYQSHLSGITGLHCQLQ